MSGTMKAMRAGGMGGGEADVGILEGDAALRRDAQPPRRLEIEVGRGLGVVDVVARRERLEAVEQAGAAEMVLGGCAARRGGDRERQAARFQEIQQLDHARLHRNALVEQSLDAGRRNGRGTRRC